MTGKGSFLAEPFAQQGLATRTRGDRLSAGEVSDRSRLDRSLELHRATTLSAASYHCAATPHTPAEPEVHRRWCLAYVCRGSFGYRCAAPVTHELVAGAVLIGRSGAGYLCTHDHHAGGDECLSFEFDEALVDELHLRRLSAELDFLPPLAQLRIWGELARVAASGAADVALDEAGLLFATRLLRLTQSRALPSSEPGARDRRRAVEAALWIEAHASESVGLDDLARLAASTPLHFLRVFTRVVGATPHQYLIRSRLAQASRLLAAGDLPVTEIALAVGFNDLSNFVRTFQRASGLPPGKLKRALDQDRSFFQVARRTMA